MKTNFIFKGFIFLLFLCFFSIQSDLSAQNFWSKKSTESPNQFQQDNNGIIYGTFGQSKNMIYSENDGVTWVNISANLPYTNPINYCTYNALCKNGILFTYTSSLNNKGTGIYKSLDKGSTWIKTSTGLGPDTNVVKMYLLSNGNILAYTKDASYNEKIFLSTDNGANWTLSHSLGGNSKKALWVNSSNEVYLYYGYTLVKSTNYGVTWNVVNSSFDNYLSDDIFKTSSGNLICNTRTTLSGNKLNFYKSVDGGLTWTDCTDSGLDNYQANTQCITSGDTIYTGTWWSTGTKSIHYSADFAETWDTVPQSGISNISTINNLVITKNGYLLNSVYLNGIYRSSLPVSVVSSGISNNLPKDIGVIIYPNPGSDKIRVEGNNIQKIEIIDINGRLIVLKDVKNNNSTIIDVSNLSKGLYSVKVTTDKGYSTGKVVLE